MTDAPLRHTRTKSGKFCYEDILTWEYFIAVYENTYVDLLASCADDDMLSENGDGNIYKNIINTL